MFAGRESDHTLLAVGRMTNPGPGVNNINASTTSVTFILYPLESDVTVASNFSGEDENEKELVYDTDYFVSYDNKQTHFFRLDGGLEYTLALQMATDHSAAIVFQDCSNALTTWGLQPATGTGGSGLLTGMALDINEGDTLYDLGEELPFTFTTPEAGANGKWAGLKFSLPVSALSADRTATGGHEWYIRGGLNNNHLDTGDGSGTGSGVTSGGGILFAIGAPLPAYITGTAASDYDDPEDLTVTVYKNGIAEYSVPVQSNGTYSVTVLPGSNYKVGLDKHVTPGTTTAIISSAFNLAYGGTKTENLAGEKPWKVSALATSSTGIGTAWGLTAAGDYLYVCNAGKVIKRVKISDGVVETFAGSGTGGQGTGIGVAATFQEPFGIVAVGNMLYVTDIHNSSPNYLRQINIGTREVSNGPDLGAYAQGIVAHGGSLYAITGYNGTDIKKIDGNTVTTFLNGFVARDMTMDNADNVLYVFNDQANNIRKVDINNPVAGGTLVAGGTQGYLDGIDSAARFNRPMFGVIDHQDEFLYVTEWNNSAVRKIEIATGKVTTIAGAPPPTVTSGTVPSVVGEANAVLGLNARFACPTGITIDAAGNLYVAEMGNSRITKLTRNY